MHPEVRVRRYHFKLTLLACRLSTCITLNRRREFLLKRVLLSKPGGYARLHRVSTLVGAATTRPARGHCADNLNLTFKFGRPSVVFSFVNVCA